MYTDESGQNWDCREEASLSNARLAWWSRFNARLEKFGEDSIRRAYAEHNALVSEQGDAITKAQAANPPIGEPGHRNPRKIAAEICSKYAARLTASSKRPEFTA